jgi:hypothetical protein
MAPVPADRRSARRYPVMLDAACRIVIDGLSLYLGSATIRNMSSKGLLVDLDQPLNAGDTIELLIRWPAGRQSMHVLGQVVRSELRAAGIEILHYKFAGRAAGHSGRDRGGSSPQLPT